MSDGNRRVIAVLSDLMFMVKIQDAAKRAGLEPVFVKTRHEVLTKALENPALIILDLNYEAADPLGTIETLKGNTVTKPLRLLGFVSHVQTELIKAAQEKGCDSVMARSAFSQNLLGILERYAGN